MPISVRCRCQAQLKVKDTLAGRRVKCPKCGEPLTVPTAPANPKPSPVTCPSCQAELATNAVLCIHCGYHLEKRQQLHNAPATKTCKRCGATLDPSDNLCPKCHVYERRKLEDERHPYSQYRQATAKRLTQMWESLLALPKDDAAALRSTLTHWPQQLLECQPPPDLLKLPDLVADNLDALSTLAKSIPVVANVITADVQCDAWPHCHERVRERTAERIGMLCHIAKRIGKSRAKSDRIFIYLLDTLSVSDDEVTELLAKERIISSLTQTFTKNVKHCTVLPFDRSSDSVGRRLEIDARKWLLSSDTTSRVSLLSTTQLVYVDDEPDPNRPARFEKTWDFDTEATSSRDAVAQAWADDVWSNVPPAVRSSLADPLCEAVDLICPHCGHPAVVMKPKIGAMLPCSYCGHNAIDGKSKELLSLNTKTTQAGDNASTAIALIVFSVLPAVGYWGYIIWSRHFAFLAFLITHLLTAGGVAGGVMYLNRARELHRVLQAQLAQETAKSTAQLRFPQAVSDNERKLKERGGSKESRSVETAK